MRTEDIKHWLDKQPFVPFRIHLSDRRVFDVTHPDQVIVFSHKIHIGIGRNKHGVLDHGEECAILHVTGIKKFVPGQEVAAAKSELTDELRREVALAMKGIAPAPAQVFPAEGGTPTRSAPVQVTKRLKGLTREGDVLLYEGIPIKELKAYPIGLVAFLVGLSHTSIWEAMSTGELRATKNKLITKEELDRWLAAGLPKLRTSKPIVFEPR